MRSKPKKKRGLKNPKAKGSRIERKIKALLEKEGYLVSKAGGSLGMFDLTAVGRYDVLLIQAKSGNATLSKAERQVLRDLQVGPFVKKLLYRWPDRAKEPIVENLGQQVLEEKPHYKSECKLGDAFRASQDQICGGCSRRNAKCMCPDFPG